MILRTAEIFRGRGTLVEEKTRGVKSKEKRMCKNKIMKLEIKSASAPMNRRERALARIQDAIFKYSGRKRENQGAMPVTFAIRCPGRHSNDLHGWYLTLGLCYSREIISLLSSMYFLAMGRESSRM